MKSKILPCLISLLLLLFKILPSFAQTNWKGNISSAWETAGNWSTGVVPTSSTDVAIGNTSTAYSFQPSITAAATANSITMGSTKLAVLTIGNTLTVTGNITLGQLGVLNANNLISCVKITVNNGGTLKVNAGSFTSNYSLTTLTLTQGSIVEYSATAIDQTISSSFAYSTLKISGAGSVKSLTADLPPLQSAASAGVGTVNVQSGTLDLSTFLADRGTTAGGTFSVSNGAFLKIGGTNGFPANYLNKSFSVGSTIEYYGGNQLISAQLYGNLTFSGSGGDVVKTMPATAFTIGGTLTSTNGTSTSVLYVAASNINILGGINIGPLTIFDGSTFSHSITGMWNNDGAFVPETSTITLHGVSTGITGNGTQAFNNLIITGSVNLINSGIVEVNNLVLTAGLGISLILSNSTLKIAGTVDVSNTANFDASNGTIEMNGTTTQHIPANTFFTNAIDNLIISNNSAGGVILDGPVDIFGSLTYTAGGVTLTTNDYLTLKSTGIKTAWIGNMTGKIITGQVTVERYLPAHKAWNLLSVPTNTTQTVKAAWQESATGTGNDPLPGYGTQITSDVATWPADGFDVHSPFPSMKKYVAATNTWKGILNTNTAGIKEPGGYMIFVRGERTADAVTSDPTETVLRTTGNLFTGDQDAMVVGPDLFASFGDPYAAPLDMRNIATSGLKNFFYVWDPQLSGLNGFGGYQTFSENEDGDYVITPGEGTYPGSGSVCNYIAGGLAFLMQAENTGGQLIFTETAKSEGMLSSAVSRGSQQTALLRTNLYGLNSDNSTFMIDGVLNNFNDDYSNAVDRMDAIKLINTSENLSIQSSGKLLVVERRQTVAGADTIALNLTNTTLRRYRFQLTAAHIASQGITGFLEDNYLHTSTPLDLNGNTLLDFTIENIPGSYAVNRFRIIFKPGVVLANNFTSVKASRENKDIAIEWNVGSEASIREYVVEKSKNGTHFITLQRVAARTRNTSSAPYLVTDIQPVEGYNYYRIKIIDRDNTTAYTAIVKVFMGKEKTGIKIYPNPIITDVISIQLNNMPAGKYAVTLFSNSGQKIFAKTILHAEGSAAELIPLNGNMPHGTYQLEIIKPGNEVITNILVH